jgi:hypothetical protein
MELFPFSHVREGAERKILRYSQYVKESQPTIFAWVIISKEEKILGDKEGCLGQDDLLISVGYRSSRPG